MSTKRHITIPAGSVSLSARVADPAGEPRALIAALHGGTYSSRYYDLPGDHASALDNFAALGYRVIAIDRPGYGATASLREDSTSFDSQAAILASAISQASQEHAPGLPVFLVGHSVGGMLALTVAATGADVGLIGVMACGLGVVWQPGIREMWASLIGDAVAVEVPLEARHQVMFGLEGTYDPAVRAASDIDSHPMAMPELIDAVAWGERMPDVGARIRVPVLCVLPEHDGIWSAGPAALDKAAAALHSAPRAVVTVQHNAGHNVDAHRAAYAHHLATAAFLEECLLSR